jgi:hypothetical protein
MAYHLWDGFDDYNAASEMWSAVSGTIQYSAAYARFAAVSGLVAQGIRFTPGGPTWKQWNMASNQPTMIFGFPAFFPQFGGAGNNRFMHFSDSATVQCSLCVTSAGALVLQQNFNGSTLVTTGPGVITPGVWHWIDILITINNASGAIQVYLDQLVGGQAVLTGSNLNTRQSANNFMNQFVVGDFGNTFNGLQIDDFHAHDITGLAPNAILGDSRLYTKMAAGQGFSTLWTPNGAGANWQCVDEQIPDDDTSYVSSNTPGQIDGYTVATAGIVVAPHGVVRRSRVRRDDAGPHTFQNGIRSASSVSLGSAFTVPSSYAWTDGGVCYVNDPATGQPFTAAAADAVQAVISMTS